MVETARAAEVAPIRRDGVLEAVAFAAEHADVSFGGLGQEGGWTLSIVRTELGQRIWDQAITEGVIESKRAMDEDPKAVELMFRLAQKSRERWPTPAELATAGATPGLIPEPPGDAQAAGDAQATAVVHPD